MTQPVISSKIETIATPDQAILLCNRLQEIAARMTDLMQQETGLLKANRPRDIMALQDDKMSLTRAFLVHFATFKSNAAFIRANAPDHAIRVRKAFNTFGSVIERNLNAIEATKAVSQGLIDVIHAVARRASGGPTCYGANATVSQATAGSSGAIALDRSL